MTLEWRHQQHIMEESGFRNSIKNWVGVGPGWVLKRTRIDVTISGTVLPLSADDRWDAIKVGYIVWPSSSTGHNDQDPWGTPDAGWQMVRTFPWTWTFVSLWQSSPPNPATPNSQKLLGSAGTWQEEDVQTQRDITVANPASQANWDYATSTLGASLVTHLLITVDVRTLWSH